MTVPKDAHLPGIIVPVRSPRRIRRTPHPRPGKLSRIEQEFPYDPDTRTPGRTPDERSFIHDSRRVHPMMLQSRTMFTRPVVTVFVACVLIAAPCTAATRKLHVDQAASKVGFVGEATMHSFKGWINSWELE